MTEKIMRISGLPNETMCQLYNSLESGPTTNWKKLMIQEFGAYYTKDDADCLERKYTHPAKALLDDLICREVTLQSLLNALEAIGNKMAISIIKRGMKKKDGPDSLDCGSCPPLETIMCQPVENTISRFSYSPRLQSREQGETLRFPVQESAGDQIHPDDPGLHVFVEMILSIIISLHWNVNVEFKMSL